MCDEAHFQFTQDLEMPISYSDNEFWSDEAKKKKNHQVWRRILQDPEYTTYPQSSLEVGALLALHCFSSHATAMLHY